LAYVEESGERFYEPELWRLHGELTLAAGGPRAAADAAEAFRRALDIAEDQQADGFAIRARERLAAVAPASAVGS
jgi:hypothetical protein